MLDVPNLGAQHVIRSRISEIVGARKTDVFYRLWRDNAITKSDIDALADWGFNSVRLPMHWNLFIKDVTDLSGSDETVWNEEGFQRVDALIAWRPHSHSDYRALVSAPSASAMCRLSQPADSAFPQVSLPKAQAQLALHLINALILRRGTRWIDVRHFKIPFVRFSWPRISSSDLTQIAHLIMASSRREPVIV